MREPSPIRFVSVEMGGMPPATPLFLAANGRYYYLEYFNDKEWEPVPIKGDE